MDIPLVKKEKEWTTFAKYFSQRGTGNMQVSGVPKVKNTIETKRTPLAAMLPMRRRPGRLLYGMAALVAVCAL